MNATLIPVREASAWRQALAALPHAFAHTWEYNFALSLTAANQQIYLWHYADGAGTVVCPVLIREWHGAPDVVTPYGFSGFAAQTADMHWFAAWQQFALTQGWVGGYLGLHPLLDARSYPAAELASTQHVYGLDLSWDETALAQRFSNNLRDRLRMWAKSGAQLTEDAAACRRFFLDHYAAFRQRVGASAAYAFSTETLDALLTHPNVYLVGGVGAQGLEAVSVFGYTAQGGEYLFNVALETGRHHSARLVLAGLQALKQRGVAWLNLGGGIRPGDGLDVFKARFGGARRPLRALKQIYAAERYRQLCVSVGAEADAKTGYFPAYRAAQSIRHANG